MDRYQAMATFLRVVDTGSFSAAARQLNIGQPAVSKTIAQLEASLQVSLLTRSTHGLSPTEAGQRYYERARIAIQEADEAELAARGAGAGLRGRLRVSAATTFARLHIVPHLPRFLAAHPDLDIDVILDDRLIDLVTEGVDVALRMGALADSAAVARKLASGERSVLAAPAYLAGAGEPRIPADLPGHQAVIYSRQPNVWSFTRGGTETSVAVHGRVRLSAAEGIRAAVLAGIGLTIASDWMFAARSRMVPSAKSCRTGNSKRSTSGLSSRPAAWQAPRPGNSPASSKPSWQPPPKRPKVFFFFFQKRRPFLLFLTEPSTKPRHRKPNKAPSS